MTKAALYLKEQIAHHIQLFFDKEICNIFNNTDILFCTYDEVVNCKKKLIAIPINIPSPANISDSYSLPFSKTEIVLWDRLPKPDGHEWVCIPNQKTPIWYKNKYGTVTPAWNLFRVLFDLLTLNEEKTISTRDRHGRFPATSSPRCNVGLLEVPIFNNAVAILVAAILGLKQNASLCRDLKDHVKPPVVILSHDVDNLLGNDLWTQAIRLYRIIEPVLSGKMPQLKHMRFFFSNAIAPKEYYFNDIKRIIDLESKNQCVSSFYILNGTRGRFGARSRSKNIAEVIKVIPAQWNVGMHYNYDTYLNSTLFEAQAQELKMMLGYRPLSGRSHYLRFDPLESFNYLAKNKIICDESAGYSDRIGYRCGIAGIFHPYNEKTESAYSMWEIPLAMMDQTLVEEYPMNHISVFNKHLRHLSMVGGAISFLFHPGFFKNPEFPIMEGLYCKILKTLKQINAEGTSSMKFLDSFYCRESCKNDFT
jgi:hypothetical protein